MGHPSGRQSVLHYIKDAEDCNNSRLKDHRLVGVYTLGRKDAFGEDCCIRPPFRGVTAAQPIEPK